MAKVGARIFARHDNLADNRGARYNSRILILASRSFKKVTTIEDLRNPNSIALYTIATAPNGLFGVTDELRYKYQPVRVANCKPEVSRRS